jgi:hypothetical protein
LLILLAGIGWGCGFAIVGFAVFKSVPGNAALAGIFGAFGFVAGAVLASLRLAMERQLPRSLSGSLRTAGDDESASLPVGSASAFGA